MGEEQSSMGLSTLDILSQLESSDGVVSMGGQTVQSADELLFSKVSGAYETLEPTPDISLEDQLSQTHIFYADLIEQLKVTNDQKLLDIKKEQVNNTKLGGGQSVKDIKYLIKVMGMVIKRIDAEQFKRAISDLAQTIEEMKETYK